MPSTTPSWPFALARFGLGARPGDGSRGGDPREALSAELEAKDGARLDAPALRATPEILSDLFAYEKRENERRRTMEIVRVSATAMPEPKLAALLIPPPMAGGQDMMSAKPEPGPQQAAFLTEAQARVERAIAADSGLTERLVGFWSNHFCVSVAKGPGLRASAGAFEREAIRPHVFGRFADMLRAVEKHPAMLAYLDNAQSYGPNSELGHARGRGLNENLAREILELHTMGAGSGYSQADVTQLAYILTGWAVGGRDGHGGDPGAFYFDERAHEPLAAELRGNLYVQPGVEQGEAALDDIAREPATADHIALKLARHFVADDPPPSLTSRLSRAFHESDGDLAVVTRALLQSEEAWSAPRTKFRTPWEITIACFRAFGQTPADVRPLLNALNLLGQPLWQPAGPNGFSDRAETWLSPEGVSQRVELAAQFARQVKNGPHPLELIHDALGPLASAATREAAQRAESVEQAYALVLLSPEFQRR